MKKHRRSFIRNAILVLSLIMALCIMATSASAAIAEQGIQPYYANMSQFTAMLNISTTGKATGSGQICLSGSAAAGNLTLELQQYTGSNWMTIKNWNSTTGSVRISQVEVWYVMPGYDYRILATAEIFNSTGVLIETQTRYSETVSY